MSKRMIKTQDDLDAAGLGGAARPGLTLTQLERLDSEYELLECDRTMLRRMREDAEQDEAERAKHYADLITYASQKLTARDAWFVIGDPAQFTRDEFYLSDEPNEIERQKLKFQAPGFFGCHWVARAAAEDALARLPSKQFCSYQWDHTPRDLLEALLSKGGFVDHRTYQGATGKPLSSNPDPNVGTLLRLATKIVDGCLDAHVLRSWLASALRGNGEHYPPFAAKLRARLKEMGAAETSEGDDEAELEDEEDDIEEDDGEETTEDADDDAEQVESPAAASDGLPTATATAPSDAAAEAE
jgi:hypothetical protein